MGLFGVAPIDVQFDVTTCRRTATPPPPDLALIRNVSDASVWVTALGVLKLSAGFLHRLITECGTLGRKPSPQVPEFEKEPS